MSYENIFIATPTHIAKRYCAGKFVDAVIKYAPGSQFHIASNSRLSAREFYEREGVTYHDIVLDEMHYECQGAIHRRVVSTVNHLRDIFLNLPRMHQCNWFLSLESDVIIKEDTLDRMLWAACESRAKVVYSNCYPGFLSLTEPGFTDRITLGCTLIHREVVEKIPFRFDMGLLAAFHDAFLAYDCNYQAIRMWYDPGIEPEHVHMGNGDRGWSQFPASEK